MFCINCGTSLPEGANFCFKCGCDLRNLAQSPGTSHSHIYAPRVGKYITFGSYPQQNGSSREPIEWLVLKVNDDVAFLVSRYGLDCRQYHHEEVLMTWENCDLRRWLNHDFLKDAFSPEDQRRIMLSEVVSTRGGNNTRDRVICLSFAEAERYFKNDAERRCRPTALAKGQGAYSSDDGYCWWWLRSPGNNQNRASYVGTVGALGPYGFYVSNDSRTVRPALRLIWNL